METSRTLKIILLAGCWLATVAPAQTLTRAFQAFPDALRSQITHVIIIYPENRSFDSLYGKFPGANGLTNAANFTQYGRSNNAPLANLPQPVLDGQQVDSRFPATIPNMPLDTAPSVPDKDCIGDLTHLFYLEQYQINNSNYTWIANDPKNAGGPPLSKFAVWSSNPGLVLSYYDEQNGGEGALAKKFVLADNCFHSAFGGSFLNHQWLIAARTPVWPAIPTAAQTPKDLNSPAGQWWPGAAGPVNNFGVALADNALTPDPTLPGFPFSNTATNLNPGDCWAINTIRPLRGPAGGYSKAQGLSVSSTEVKKRLPLQTYDTIGDRLNDANISWAWFSGGWNKAKLGTADPLFQFHHQPFAYFAKYALAQSPIYLATNPPVPGVDSTDPNNKPVGFGIGSANHLLDEDADFYRMLAAGALPQVSFVKPNGADNSHPGYASVKRGQDWVANVVHHIQQSSYWSNTVVFICYDEHGGLWDHVIPPVIDRWGPGLRVPFIIISPWSKKGFVDHNEYETVSILAFIEGLYNLPPLNTRDANALPPVAAFLGEPDLFLEVKVGQPVTYQIPACNRPLSYQWTGPANGLVFDATTGKITGKPIQPGHFKYNIIVTGADKIIQYVLQVDVTKP